MPLKLNDKLDPTTVTKARMAAAGLEGPAAQPAPPVAAPPTMSQSQFGRPWSEAERAMQQQALIEMLRRRQ